jgi:hypothetical protein
MVAAGLTRASISGPRVGTFFRRQGCARTRDHVPMMIGPRSVVNPRTVEDEKMKGAGDENKWRRKDLQTKRSGDEKKSRARKSPA